MREFLGPQPPEKPKGLLVNIRWPKPKKPLRITALADMPWSLIVHWIYEAKTGRAMTQACHGIPQCVWCMDGIEKKWAAYLPAWDHNAGAACACVMGRITWAKIEAHLDSMEPLRGCKFLLTVAEDKSSGPVLVTRENQGWAPDRIPPAPDIRPVLRAVVRARIAEDAPAPTPGDETGAL